MLTYRAQLEEERKRKKLRQRFHGHPTLRAKRIPAYPISAEREYMRLAWRYVYAATRIFKDGSKRIERECRKGLRKDARYDDIQSVQSSVHQIIMQMTAKLEKVLERLGLEQEIWKVAKLAQNVSLREWLNCVKATFGIDLERGYYNGEFYAEILNPWIADNLARIKSFPGRVFGQVERHISDGIKAGTAVGEMMAGALALFGKTVRQARATARNQIGNLASKLNQKHQTDSGCRFYIWRTCEDDRVRPCHASLDGRMFRWDSPPEMWYVTKRGVVHTGRTCHPGEDYNCRCVAQPVFTQEFITLPAKAGAFGGKKAK